MRFTFTVNVEVERDTGPFASRDEMAEQIQDALDAADPQNLSGDSGGEYSVTTWDITEEPQPKVKRRG